MNSRARHFEKPSTKASIAKSRTGRNRPVTISIPSGATIPSSSLSHSARHHSRRSGVSPRADSNKDIKLPRSLGFGVLGNSFLSMSCSSTSNATVAQLGDRILLQNNGNLDGNPAERSGLQKRPLGSSRRCRSRPCRMKFVSPNRH